MKRADVETTVGDKVRRGARVTEQRLKETSANLCRNKAMLFHFPFKALCQTAAAYWSCQSHRKIIRQAYKKTRAGSKGALLAGKGGNPNDTRNPATAL